jgi:hypothetical protein
MDLHQLADAYIPYTLIETRPERLKRKPGSVGTKYQSDWHEYPVRLEDSTEILSSGLVLLLGILVAKRYKR